MADIHAVALNSFSTAAQTYARGRPEYPVDILAWLTGALGVTTDKVVVDLGAGTGKFTKLLVQTTANVIAVEPVAAMRAQLAERLAGAQAIAGTAEAIPLKTASADVLVCAQAFHWFATELAIREIHRVLRPGGRLGLVWNVRDESVDWVEAITKIIEPYEGDAPRLHKGDWRKTFSGRYFNPLQETSFAYHHVGPAQEVILDRFLSVSFISALPAHEKAKVAEQLRILIESHPALHGKNLIDFPYRTKAYWCARLDEDAVPR
jgi:SAM-dependent methyltransferase